MVGPTRISPRTRSGWRTARSTATRQPRELPSNTTGGSPVASSQSARCPACSATFRTRPGSSLSPKPGRSITWTGGGWQVGPPMAPSSCGERPGCGPGPAGTVAQGLARGVRSWRDDPSATGAGMLCSVAAHAAAGGVGARCQGCVAAALQPGATWRAGAGRRSARPCSSSRGRRSPARGPGRVAPRRCAPRSRAGLAWCPGCRSPCASHPLEPWPWRRSAARSARGRRPGAGCPWVPGGGPRPPGVGGTAQPADVVIPPESWGSRSRCPIGSVARRAGYR